MNPKNIRRNCRIKPIALALLLVLVATLLLAFLPQPALADGWYNTDWAYRKSITIDYGKVDSTQTDFPVLISLTTDGDLATDAQDNGNDILFTSSDGEAKLSHEIEEFDDSDGKLIAWVEVPSLSHSGDTVLYMYYGNAGCINQQNPTGVWDTSYKGVWHLLGDGTAALPSATGSNDGTKQSAGHPADISGKIDGAQDFDGTNDYVNLGKPANLNFVPDDDDFTLEAWIKTTHNGGTIVSKRGGTGGDCTWQFYTNGNDLGGIVGGTEGDTTHAVADGAWHHVVMVNYDDAGTQKFKFYVDGGPATDGGGTSGSNTDDVNVMIGDSSVHAWAFKGTIDEVRISNKARSGDWIKTGYNNQKTPSEFYELGDEERHWESYQEVGHTNIWGTVANPYTSAFHTVYMKGHGFAASHAYDVGYYDATFDGDGHLVGNDVGGASTAGGVFSSLCDCRSICTNSGTWHSVVFDAAIGDMPNTYTGAKDDLNYVTDDDFEVAPSLIPEFPTVVTAIAVCMLCAVAYVVMRRKVGEG